MYQHLFPMIQKYGQLMNTRWYVFNDRFLQWNSNQNDFDLQGNLKFAAAIEPDNQDIVQVLERVEKNKISIPSTIAQERLINPFMRVNLKVFYCVVCSDIFSIQSLQELSGIDDPIKLMGKLREMKNEGKTTFDQFQKTTLFKIIHSTVINI